MANLSSSGSTQPEIQAQVGDETRTTPFLHSDNHDFFLETCVPMYRAAMKGDWKAASTIIDGCNAIVRSAITIHADTPLHVASSTNRLAFVRELLKKLQKHDLALRNSSGITALCLAAQSGATEIASMMIDMNPDLVHIPGNQGQFPLLSAVNFGHKKTVSLLFERTNLNLINDATLAKLFHNLISSNLFNFAVKMLEIKDTLAISRDSNMYTALHSMAIKPYAISPNRMFLSFFRGRRMSSSACDLIERLWNQIVRQPQFSTFLTHPTNLIFEAAAAGNAEFLAISISKYPDLIWILNENNQTIFHIAAVNRHESVFALIFEIGSAKCRIMELVDSTGCNILHLTARLPPQDRLQGVSGAAFQMQRELLWFEVVKNMVPPAYIESKAGEYHKTPDVIFAEEHQTLRKEGEKWLKGTSTTCMIVATLIATLVFAAAINVPGGFDDKEYPVLVDNAWFEIFYCGAAVAFVCSSLAIVLFMSILTSRNSATEFRTMLPFGLMFGLLLLFVSILAMVTSFCGAVIIMHHSKIVWKMAMIICLVFFTGMSFIALHLKLFSGMLRAAYWSKFFFQPHRQRLFI